MCIQYPLSTNHPKQKNNVLSGNAGHIVFPGKLLTLSIHGKNVNVDVYSVWMKDCLAAFDFMIFHLHKNLGRFSNI